MVLESTITHYSPPRQDILETMHKRVFSVTVDQILNCHIGVDPPIPGMEGVSPPRDTPCNGGPLPLVGGSLDSIPKVTPCAFNAGLS